MKRIFQLAFWAYPADWRKKYGAEFQALLDDVRPSWKAIFDVLRGGVQMQLKHMSLMKLTVACAVAGVVVATAGAFSIKDTYQSSTLVRITPPDAAKTVNELAQRTFSGTSLTDIIEKYDLYSDSHGGRRTDAVHRMRQDIAIRPVSQQPLAFSLSYAYTDRQKAQAVAGALIDRLMNENIEMAIKSDTPTNGITLELLEAPALAEAPVCPNRLTTAAGWTRAGGNGGATIGLSRRYWRSA